MDLPPTEACRQLFASHVLLGAAHLSDERREEFRQELIKLLAAHGLAWTDWPEFFSLQNMQSTQALPSVNSSEWKKAHFPTLCHLHGQIGADDKTGPVAHKKLIKTIGDYRLSWSGDLPAILAADWTFKNPPSAAASPSSDAPTINVFALTKKVIGDRIVMKPAELTVTTLIVLNTHVCDRFARIPQLGAVAPTSGYGKTTLLKEVLQHLVSRKWYSSDTTAAGFYRRVRNTPNITALLDQREHQAWDRTLWNLIDIAFEGGGKDLVIDGKPVNITLFIPVFWGIRGEIHDVPLSILSRGFQVLLEEGKPKIRLMAKDDPAYYADLIIAREEISRWAATVSLDTNPKLPAELDNNRLADVCRPLLSIADALVYGAEARATLIEICAARPPQDMGVQALIDAKIAFKMLGVDRRSKIDLAKAIVRYGHPYWAYWRGPKDNKEPHELTAVDGALFGRFGIYPKNIWPAGPRESDTKSFWGYQIEQFEQVWDKYCPGNGTKSAKIITLPKPQSS